MTLLNRFPKEAQALAHALTLQPYLWERPQVEGITIDGEDSRDLDDAIWIEATPTEAILSVHIADVSELVQMGSILDKVAIARTTTQYFKVGNAPMLPRALSEDKLSLWEYQDRPTLTIRVTLNRNAEIEQTEILETWLRSRKKFHYQEAESAQKDPHHPFSKMLQTAYSWAEQLYRLRIKSGAIGATLTAQGDWLNEEGSLIKVKSQSAHLLIQEFMILANRAVAQWLADQDIPMLFRNHTARAIAPDRETMYKEMLMLRSAQAVRQRMASWLNRADYSPTLVGHFGLNLPAYCHITSPIRRLADLINHRIVKATLKGEPSPYTKTELEQLGKHIAQVTREIEKETAQYFKDEHQKVYEQQIQDVQELERLSPKEFSRVLKFALEQGNLSDIAPVFQERLQAGKLQVLDLYLVLFKGSDHDLQHQVMAYLNAQMQDATSVISIASTQEENWQFDYVECSQSPFTTWLEVTIGDEVLTTVYPVSHSKRQPARHQASVLWLEAYLKDELVPPSQRVEPQPPAPDASPANSKEQAKSINGAAQAQQQMHRHLTRPLLDGQNFVGMLNDLCQRFGWETPAYEFTELNQVFYCECYLQAQTDHIAGKSEAKAKQRAKAAAARQVMEQLQAIAQERWGEWSGG